MYGLRLGVFLDRFELAKPLTHVLIQPAKKAMRWTEAFLDFFFFLNSIYSRQVRQISQPNWGPLNL